MTLLSVILSLGVLAHSPAYTITPKTYTLRRIAVPSGYSSTILGGGLNEASEAVVSFNPSTEPTVRGFFDNGASQTALARLATNKENRAFDLNDNGRIFGSAVDTDDKEKPAHWTSSSAGTTVTKHDLGTNPHGARFLDGNNRLDGSTPKGEACGWIATDSGRTKFNPI